ncbi:MAG TPA: hypothetical protein VK837_13125 [Longimicrobiales bacterium]|nr:hypothetical protein [Longimicrobiales bacterium]
MSRRVTDDELRTWEVYATAGSFGLPEHARIVFHCLSDPDLRALWSEREGDRQEVEAWLESASEEELAEAMAAAEELR